MPYKVVVKYPDGSVEEDDEVFDTEEEAEEYGLVQLESYSAGGEILHLHNPGDYPETDDDADYEVIEVEG